MTELFVLAWALSLVFGVLAVLAASRTPGD